jgi:hypothetical protein
MSDEGFTSQRGYDNRSLLLLHYFEVLFQVCEKDFRVVVVL